MNRRDFIKSSIITAAGVFVLSGKKNIFAAEELAKITTRKYKNLDISLLGFGCMRLPTNMGQINESEAAKMVEYAMKNGVNYYDTAWPYHGGKSEISIGKILKKYPRNSFYLADKFPIWGLNSEKQVSEIFEEQLKKCQIDYFDFYLVHAVDRGKMASVEKYKVYEILKKKKDEGKIKFLGFSYHEEAGYLETVIKSHEWDFVQLQINPVDWNNGTNAKLLYETAVKYKLPVIVMNPLKGGQLSSLNSKALNILKTSNPDVSTASWSIRYAASLPNVITVLSGMTTMEHVKDNIKSLTNFSPLSEKESNVLTNAMAAYNASGAVSCTYCRYCIDCPIGIDIPKIFSLYNEYKVTDDKNNFKAQYNKIDEAKRADKCINCKLCMAKCPQKLNIPDLLKEVVKVVNG